MMQSCADGGAPGTKSTRNYKLLSGVCMTALAIAFPTPAARAASFEASSQTELYQAIADAEAHGDAASTITLTGSFSLDSSLPAISGKNITIATGTNTLSYNPAVSFNVTTGASLTLTGNILGSGVLNPGVLSKVGGGQLTIGGATGAGITRIGLGAGHTLINGGSRVTFGSSAGGTVSQLDIAGEVGQVASLTVSGQGTRLVATGTDPNDLSGGAGSQSTLTIEDGAVYTTTRAIRVHTTSSQGTATVNVQGEGSTLEAASFISTNGTSYINVLDGGLVDISGATSFGGAGNASWYTAQVMAQVSGEGSRWNSGAIAMYRGSLSILDGGVMTGTTVNIATVPGNVVPNFNVLVSGEGSELSGTAINLGTTGTGVLTIANGSRVVVNGGGSALVMGGLDPDSNATLNIGGAVGQVATGAGTLEASAITLAATADINFNHTEAGYIFDLPINGSGAINQLAGRTIFNTNQTGFTGLASVYGGTLEVNGMLGGIIDVRGGTLAGIGSVGDTRNFAGGAIAPGINGIGTLTIDGNYTGNGGTLQIDTSLGSDSSPTDLLAITGESILGAGATRVFVTNFGGAGAETIGDGIKIVDVAGTSATNAFVLGAPAIGGAYLYGLFQNGIVDPTDGDWYLRMTDTLAPTVPIYENYPIVLLGLTDLPTLQQRVGDRYWPGASEVAGSAMGDAGPRNFWTRIEGAHGHVEGGSTAGASYDSSRYLVQAGIDGLLTENGSGVLIGGINAQYGRVNAAIRSSLGNGTNSTDSYGGGATLTWYGSDGVYVDGQASVTRLSSKLAADAVGKLVDDNQGLGYAFSIEAGRKVAVSGNWSVTPQAQLAYASVDIDEFADPFGAKVSLDSGDSLKGRIGVALNYDAGSSASGSHVYGIANLTYEFLDGTAVDVAGTKIAFEPDSFGAELGLGGTYRWAGGKYALYGEALASTSFEGSYGFKGTVGFSTAF
ncbi:fibronectin-binding autotransporter adhesin [Aminobacter aminovorans]|uniref:Adhesin/invasin TibA autotransporter n=2 Tax=Aminobacter aminovorans TaxID=83263 RepID=A0A380WF16_AMIAI|nr:fibronectin-binding autotransporter adhesin [Aminobacter aminovorans]SUU87619.1 Adhesin/invasin TibA autotransporter precursor [Aminobacter aminovorans]